MKRTFKSWLAAAALAFVGLGSLLTASPAHAAITPVTQNSVTCNRYDGGLFPANSRYFNCTHGAGFTGYNSTAQSTINLVLNSVGYPQVRPVLQNGTGTRIFIFNDAMDMGAWWTYPVACCTTAQKQQIYSAYFGSSAATLDPNQIDACDVRVFVAKAVSGYPVVVKQTTSEFTSTVAHELGHCFDALTNAPTSYTHLSASSTFNTLYNKDKLYLQTNDPNYATDIVTYAYWLNNKDELFAQEFARTEVGSNMPVDNVIGQYMSCTLKYTQTWMKFKRNPTAAEFTSAGLSRCN
jgi:hypothetical protein